MTVYLKKKKLLSDFFGYLAVFIVAAFALFFLLKDNDVLNLLFIVIIIVVSMISCFIGFVSNLITLLWRPKVMVKIDENGLILRLTKIDRKAGLITWNEILKIDQSTDNMNKPAIRISLKENRNGQYLYYITFNKIDIPIQDLLSEMIEYHEKYK